MAKVYLGLGSNLGDKGLNLLQAIEQIEKQIGPIVARSVFFVSEPWGFESSNTFLNACIASETTLTPLECLYCLKDIEKAQGRLKNPQGIYIDRVIDLDILFFDDMLLNDPHLVIPHPLLHQRDFVLKPLSEIAPNLFHPILKKTIKELLSDLNEQS